jgi:hypothetical protein
MQEVNGVVTEYIYDGGEGTLREGVKIIQNGYTYCLVADKDFSICQNS